MAKSEGCKLVWIRATEGMGFPLQKSEMVLYVKFDSVSCLTYSKSLCWKRQDKLKGNTMNMPIA